ncbi:effector 5 protein [Pleurostoma richardsiae]|uniref:Effector 5 protein n=1 Tax=Pleurostoma richardsiae TaxID=41990 RepID=A0AA38RM64_9PEZI|nr:effector 5 protein [Pleurostoma richardsiae]
MIPNSLLNFTLPAPVTKRSFSCRTLAYGLSAADCQHMSDIGMAGQGANPTSNNGVVWIGSDGPNTFTFTNQATNPSPVPVALILWNAPSGDYQASFMNVRTPQISYSLPNTGDSVTISVANGISGAWAALNNQVTVLSQYGQIYNTWGEFTTGQYATVDISREVNMGGNVMSLKVAASGCVANMYTCAFQCKSGNTCGSSGTYDLVNCAAGSQPGASYGTYDGNPSGGCTGFSNGGHLDIELARY